MTRARLRIAAVAVVWGASATITPTAQQVMRTNTQAVVVGVSVTTAGRPVRGLNDNAFVLLDNGVPQRVTRLEGTQPMDVSLWLDVSGSVAAPERLWQAANQITGLLTDGDRLEIVRLANAPQLVLPLSLVPVTLPARDDLMARDRGVTRVLDAVAMALMRPGVSGRRHVVVVLTDGADVYSVVASGELPLVARRSDAALFIVRTLAGDYMRAPESIRVRDQAALDLATATTGGAVVQAKDAVTGFRDLLAKLDEQYVLGYTPEGVPAGGWHDIKVELKDPKGATVAARRGYFGG